MGEYAEYEWRRSLRGGIPNSAFRLPPVPHWPKVACPVCGKMCGGRGDTQTQGVHQHMKFKHGIKQKWKREQMLEVGG